MSLDQLLAGLKNQESGDGGGATSFIDVAEVRVFFGWEGYSDNVPKYFEYVPDSTDGRTRARAECEAYIKTDTMSQWAGFAKDGICIEIYGDDIPTHKDGKFEWGNSVSFANQYESDANISKLTEEEKAKITGPMPYNLVIDALKEHITVADWKPHWCKLEQKINQWQKAKGKTNKKGYDKRLYVIQHVYTNEAEAKADAETIKAEQAFNQPQSVNGQLSPKAHETWGEGGLRSNDEILEYLRGEKDNIRDAIRDAKKGIRTPKNVKLGSDEAEDFAAEGYGISLEDFALIGVVEVPF